MSNESFINYEYLWDTNDYTDDIDHNIGAIAFDQTGNNTIALSITVHVDNNDNIWLGSGAGMTVINNSLSDFPSKSFFEKIGFFNFNVFNFQLIFKSKSFQIKVLSNSLFQKLFVL